ncbi:hypothetical protein ACN1C3_30200 [Pseudomonas sp. H11T01]|uniref:hypothetical protein n=1 Tax=Pseudomonas sp. H11T01 TaxID=3402749 RepID=UPI003ACBEA72
MDGVIRGSHPLILEGRDLLAKLIAENGDAATIGKLNYLLNELHSLDGGDQIRLAELLGGKRCPRITDGE